MNPKLIQEVAKRVAASPDAPSAPVPSISEPLGPIPPIGRNPDLPDDAVYGYCPTCGSAGKSRERRPMGNDTCVQGHVYPSSSRLLSPKGSEPV